MKFNIDFEFMALIMLIVVMMHMRIDQSIKSLMNRFFRAFSALGVICITLDILTWYIIGKPNEFPVTLQNVMIYISYVFWLLMPYMLYLYVRCFRHALKLGKLAHTLSLSLPFFITTILVFTNPWTHLLFYFTNGHYARGSIYWMMFVYGLCYLVLSQGDVLIHRHQIPPKWAFGTTAITVVTIITVIVQIIFQDVLILGVGVSIDLIAIAMTINNPSVRIDSLTGLYDREAFKETLAEYYFYLKDALVITVACDDIKRVNVLHGMDVADRIFFDIARHMSDLVGKGNCYRYMGDRFIGVVTRPSDFDYVMKSLKLLFKEDYHIDSQLIPLNATIVAIPLSLGFKSVEDVIDFLDHEVVWAKEKYKGSAVVLDSLSKNNYARYKEIEHYLDYAIDQDLFEVYYQPIYSLEKDQFISLEALARLNHPKLGPISPSEFIEIAEKNGNIIDIERCLFKKICLFLSYHKEIFSCIEKVKVNLSPITFINDKVPNEFLGLIQSSHLNPQIFQFEITETTATVYEDVICDWAAKIKNMGAGLCLDDFGSGYANIDAAMKLPFDVIKFDRSVLLEANRSPKSAVLYASASHALRDIGYEVVAEGAETKEDVDFLIEKAGVDQIQGFFFARPMSEEKLLQSHRERKCHYEGTAL